MTWSEILVSIAQVAAGGGIVQAIMAFSRRRQLRQLDRQTDSVAVETADKVVLMLRTELDTTKAENADLKQTQADQQRQIQALAEQVSVLRAELAVARTEIARLSGP
ncbi:hypothetical protein ACIBG7_43310 [Nonomuraea sp. NPDC050328]|uniref:hypothetical protein n=1 Tax=Nonomuraea sp. NPDC050328 TaxID=3364361 RepID=UPI0037BA961A